MDKLVLTFHYVWYGTPHGPAGEWRAWPARESGHDRYRPDQVFGGKRMIMSPNYPLDGPYDSLDPVLIERQLIDLRSARIDASIVSWWGVDDYSDRVLDALVDASAAHGHKVTIYYETPMLGWRVKDSTPAQRVLDDIKYVLHKHSHKESWLKVGGKPVIVIYVVDTQPLDVWREAKAGLVAEGFQPFFLGDSFKLDNLDVMDGLHTYNPVGRLARGEDLAALYRSVAEGIHARGKLFAATVLPGYDDRKIRTPGTYLPRESGGCYDRTWRAALASEADWVLVTSWNEWFEGSEIEPSIECGTDYLWQTAQYACAFRSR
jgi:glycoprotein endo-alpha-1,2-mannosidase